MPANCICDVSEQSLMLTRMVAVRGEMDHVNMKVITELCVGPHTHWSHMVMEKPIDLCLSQTWKQKHGAWDHGFSGKETNHNTLGMAFAQHVLDRSAIADLVLSDEPDFSGRCRGKRVYGDIGKCSASAMFGAIRHMDEPGCLWISVLSASEQVILEFGYPVSQAISSVINERLTNIRTERRTP